MTEKKEQKQKGFIARLLDKLDKKLENKSRQTPCCCDSKKEKGKSCC